MEKGTLVFHSDLLGFGNLVASANGTFSSPVGQSAFRKIELLREALFDAESLFPVGTEFFQLNDLIVACLDIEIDITSMTIDAGSIASSPISNENSNKLLKFISASASLHQKALNKENDEQLGPGPRSFIVLGKRWVISQKPNSSNVTDLPKLQANMAMAEAYQADSLGSTGGFVGSPWDRLYVNDYIWHLLISISKPLARHLAQYPIDVLKRLDGLGIPGGTFPENLSRNSKIKVQLFYRDREFVSIMSHHACEILNRING